MKRFGPYYLFRPFMLAVRQLDDPTFSGVVFRSIGWSLVCFLALHFAAVGIIHRLLAGYSALTWIAEAFGSIVVWMLALWLFLPIAVIIGTLYFDRIALCVERRFYPWVPPPNHASLREQALDGAMVALKVLGLNVVGLGAALFFPVFGLAAGWLVGAYAIARGLFVAVAMRRMPQSAAELLYREHRPVVMAQGLILTLASYVPVANLFVPVLSVATMVHLLDIVLISVEYGRPCPRRHLIGR